MGCLMQYSRHVKAICLAALAAICWSDSLRSSAAMNASCCDCGLTEERIFSVKSKCSKLCRERLQRARRPLPFEDEMTLQMKFESNHNQGSRGAQ